MTTMASQITCIRLFAQQVVEAYIKEYIKVPDTGGFPSQRANNAENVSIVWRHHEMLKW